MSLFELPVSRHARTVRLVLVLALDAMLAGAGIYLFLAYLAGRDPPAARQIRSPVPTAAAIVEAEPARVLGAVDLDAGVAAGGPEAAALASLFAAHGQDLERCYQRAVSTTATVLPLAGSLVLRLSIVADGGIRRVTASSNDTGSPQLAACVVSLVDGWSLPAGSPRAAAGEHVGDVDLEWQLRFRAPPAAPRGESP